MGLKKNSCRRPEPILCDFVTASRSFSLNARRRATAIIAKEDGAGSFVNNMTSIGFCFFVEVSSAAYLLFRALWPK